MLGTNMAQEQIHILTLADLPMTFKRQMRKFFTGSPLTKQEIFYGRYSATSFLSEARFWAGTSFEAPGDDQLLALETENAVMHFTVKRVINATNHY